MHIRCLIVRAGSKSHASGGTIHLVIRVSFHEKYNPNNGEYDVAVLQVCTDFNIQIDSAKCDVFLVIFSFISFIVLLNVAFVIKHKI